MSPTVVDASVAIKWVIPEAGTREALALLSAGGLCAPDLITAECANILWKKTRLQELTAEEASIAARLIEHAAFEIHPTRHLLQAATDLAIRIDHPAYDCVYLALALQEGGRLVTADARLIRKLSAQTSPELQRLAEPLLPEPHVS